MAVGKVSVPSIMDIYDVKEMFSWYYVDLVVAQQNVPSKWKVKTHENGKALLLVMVQNIGVSGSQAKFLPEAWVYVSRRRARALCLG